MKTQDMVAQIKELIYQHTIDTARQGFKLPDAASIAGVEVLKSVYAALSGADDFSDDNDYLNDSTNAVYADIMNNPSFYIAED